MTNVSVNTNDKGELKVTIDVTGCTKYTVEVRNYKTAALDLTTITGGGSGTRSADFVGGGGAGGGYGGQIVGGLSGVSGVLGSAGAGAPGRAG